MTTCDNSSQNQTLVYQRLCDRVFKLETDNTLLREWGAELTAKIANLKQSTESNTLSIQHFSDTFISETIGLKSSLEAITEQLEGLEKIKEQ